MKPTLFLILLLVASGCTLAPQMPEGKNIQINVLLDDAISNCEQWVYLHSQMLNEYLINDSVFIKKGQKKITLYGYTPEENSFNILFSKKGPINMKLILTPNSYVETEVSEADGMNCCKEVKGSYATYEYAECALQTSALQQRERELWESLSIPSLSDEEKDKRSQEIEKLGKQIDSIQMKLLTTSVSPTNVWEALVHFNTKVQRDSLTILVKNALRKYPNDKRIKGLIYQPRGGYPPASKESVQRSERIHNIIQERIRK